MSTLVTDELESFHQFLIDKLKEPETRPIPE